MISTFFPMASDSRIFLGSVSLPLLSSSEIVIFPPSITFIIWWAIRIAELCGGKLYVLAVKIVWYWYCVLSMM